MKTYFDSYTQHLRYSVAHMRIMMNELLSPQEVACTQLKMSAEARELKEYVSAYLILIHCGINYQSAVGNHGALIAVGT